MADQLTATKSASVSDDGKSNTLKYNAYWGKIDKLFTNKKELKDATVKDLEANAIVGALIMTVAFGGLIVTPLEYDGDYLNDTKDFLIPIYVLCMISSAVSSALAVLYAFFQLLLILKTPQEKIIQAMMQYEAHTVKYPFYWLQIGLLTLFCGLLVGIFLMYGIIECVIAGVIICFGFVMAVKANKGLTAAGMKVVYIDVLDSGDGSV